VWERAPRPSKPSAARLLPVVVTTPLCHLFADRACLERSRRECPRHTRISRSTLRVDGEPLSALLHHRPQPVRGDEPTRRRALLAKIAEAARAGVDYIQLREKDLSTRELEMLAQEALTAVRNSTH